MTYFGKTRWDCSGVSQPWETRFIEGRGFCAFATKQYKAGDLICIEKPLVIVKGHHPFNSKQLEEIDNAVNQLSDEHKEAFFAMANVFTDAPTIGAGIFMTNSFDMTDCPTGSACAIYCAIGRLNHSCTPNAQQSHLPETGEEVLYASRFIEEGEEINDCYIDLRNTRAKRLKILSQDFRFVCRCSSCENNNNLNYSQEDQDRSQAMNLENLIIEYAESGETENALNLGKQLVNLLEKEQNKPWSIRYLASAHMYNYHLYLSMNKKKNAIRSLRFANELNLLLQGNLSPDSLHTSTLLGSNI